MYRHYVLKRIFFGLMMYIVMVFTFSLLFNTVTENTLRQYIDEQVTQELKRLKNVNKDTIQRYIEERTAEKVHQFHLDDPFYLRVFWRAADTLTFNFHNAQTLKASNGDREVLGILAEAIPNTLTLFLTEIILVLLLGVPMGLWAARRPNGGLDRTISSLTMVTNGLPSFWFGMVVIMTFAYGWPNFPSGGVHEYGVEPGTFAYFLDFLWHLALPLLTLTFLGVWSTAYLTRNIVLSNLQEDYIMSARARGIPERSVLLGHTLRSAMPAILTLAVLSVFSSISGNIVVESVFNWPGLGNLYYKAVQQNDIPVLMATLSIQAIINLVGFIGLDIVYGLLDPRVKVGGKR